MLLMDVNMITFLVEVDTYIVCQYWCFLYISIVYSMAGGKTKIPFVRYESTGEFRFSAIRQYLTF